MLNPDGSKTCPRCALTLPTDCFYRIARKGGRDGFGGYCKLCTKAKALEWQAANAEKLPEIWARRSKVVQARYAAGLVPPEQVAREKELDRAWTLANPEKVKQYQKAYKKRSRDMDPVRFRAVNAMNQNRRRARRKGVPTDMTIDDWEALLSAFDRACPFCGCRPKWLDLDHIVPLHLGGHDVVGNISPICRPCNGQKSYRDPREFAKEMEVDLLLLQEKCRVRESQYPLDSGTLLSTGTST